MKKYIFKMLFCFSAAFMLTRQIQVNATESVSSNSLNTVNNDISISDNDILQETETSIVIDMHMQPAKQHKEKKTVYENPLNPYKTTKSPAQITKQGGYYFITDTFHDQIIYSSRLEEPITQWRVMTSKVTGPHAVASDGTYYLVADTENDRVLIFEWNRGGFRLTQEFEKMGIRPHYIEYDEETDSFYVWSSMTCEMYILAKDSTGIICIKEIRGIKELKGHYIRSFTISGEYIIFPSGTNKQILIVKKETLQIIGRFLVPDNVSGMAYIKPIGNYFYMTVSSDEKFDQSKATIIRTKDLSGMINGEYEDISSVFPHIKIPYYIDCMQGIYYMTNHGSSKNVIRFQVINDEIKYVNAMEF